MRNISPAERSFQYMSSNCSVPTMPLIAFLERIQEDSLRTFGVEEFDPKLYIDMSLKKDLGVTEERFASLPRNENGAIIEHDLTDFLHECFNEAGIDLVLHQPVDFVSIPPTFLPAVNHFGVRPWALEIHSLWRNLSRKVSSDVSKNPDLHTLLPLPNPLVIPGSRFREVYYWDSYWIIRGLLVSKMYDTAKGIVTNLISFVNDYGFVLNGARSYYTNRSQPPLLSSMVVEIFKSKEDLMFVNFSLPALIKEYEFWISDLHLVQIQDEHGTYHNLSRYHANWNKPRPESSTMDKEVALKLRSDDEKQRFYLEVASTAESGWDFSTRFMRNVSDLTTLVTTMIIPVDLNAFLLKTELDISYLAQKLGDKNTAEKFLDFSKHREKAIRSILWNDQMNQWVDFWLDNDTRCEHDPVKGKSGYQNKKVYASNFIPLWISSFSSDSCLVEKVMKSLKESGLICSYGVATSLTDSGQQWDFPNGWAPLQHMIVEGLAKSGLEEAKALAEQIAVSWITTNYIAYKKSGVMHEKYDVRKCGEQGAGGEYKPQTGFGWSNGVILAFLEEFGCPEDRNLEFDS